MKSLTALVLVICVHCFNAEKDFALRLKALEHEFATKLQQDDLRIRNLEETVKRQQMVLYDQWKTIQQLNDRLETQTNIIKRLVDGHSSVQEVKDLKSIGTPADIMDPVLSRIEKKDALRELNEPTKEDSFFSNQQRILNFLAKKETHETSTKGANWTSTNVGRIDSHDTLDTDENNREKHNVGPKYSRAITNPVAFTAIKTQSQTGIGVNQNIVFDHAILNDGGSFNTFHGIFTAPVTGYYLFSTTILHPPQSKDLHAGIMHNGGLIAMVLCRASVWEQGSLTVVLKVRAGEQVWVGNKDFTNEIVHGDYYSSFTGFLLLQL